MSATIAQSGLVFASAPVRHSLASSDVPGHRRTARFAERARDRRPLAAPAAEERHGEEADHHDDDEDPADLAAAPAEEQPDEQRQEAPPPPPPSPPKPEPDPPPWPRVSVTSEASSWASSS